MKYLFVAMMVGLSVSAFLWVLLLSQNRDLKSQNQQAQEKFQGLSKRYVSLDWEMKQFRSQLGQSEYRRSLLVAEVAQLKSQLVPPAQFESQRLLFEFQSPQARLEQLEAQCRCSNQATDH